MSAEERLDWISHEEYLEGEKRSPVRHWYRQGQVFAMAGASDSHEAILFNLTPLLRGRVRDMRCRGYAGGMKAQIEAFDVYYYPDLMVTCDERDLELEYFKLHPRLIVEVLSRTTEAFDRGEKFEHYRSLDSLQEYVLISQQRMAVECFRRDTGNRWIFQAYGPEDELVLESLDFRCPVRALYEDVRLPGEAEEAV